ncbi:MAG TPA: phospholipase D-like domain-containing protein [Candidatus Eremiobacteraceae bacterium]
MNDLSVCFGGAARDTLCRSFDSATVSITGEFYDLKDPAVNAAIARARARHVVVDIRTEHKRHDFGTHPVLHAKTAVVDGRTAILTTANVTRSGFSSPGEVCVIDENPHDVIALRSAIAGSPSLANDSRVIAGPGHAIRAAVESLLGSRNDLRIASEDLSDERVVRALIARLRAGHSDRVLVNTKGTMSTAQRRTICRLTHAGIAVRAPGDAYMHEKYVDDGDRIYIGSANLTRNGLDEGCEIGLVARAADFGAGAADLRANFDTMWRAASPARYHDAEMI